MPSALPSVWPSRLFLCLCPEAIQANPQNQPLSHWPQPPTALVCAGLRTTTSTVQPRDPTRKPKLYALPATFLRQASPGRLVVVPAEARKVQCQ